jgi:hypothetical protein
MNEMTITIKSKRMYHAGTVVTLYCLFVNGTLYATYATQAEAEAAAQFVNV